MEKFSQSDVAMLSCFWAHPHSGRIYQFGDSHTLAATDPNGPMAIEVDELSTNDSRVFEIAFRAGWVRSMYLPANGKMPSQLGLHGADEATVKKTLRMLLASGIVVTKVGLEGHFDNYQYGGSPEDIRKINGTNSI